MSTAAGTAATDEATASTEARSPRAENKGPRWAVLVVAGLCVLTVALRALIALRSGVWRDEAQLLFIVDEPSWAAMLDFLRQHESHPPLFYAVMRVCLSITGDSDAAALALPIVLGAALVPALYVVGARLLSWRAGLLAAAAAAVSPILAGVGAMARPYSLLPLLTLAGTYALVRAIQSGGRLRWAGYAAAMLALVYTHNWGWLVLAAHWVALAICLLRGLPRPRAAVLRGWAGAQAAVALGFLPWLPPFRYQTAHAGYSPFHVFGRIDSASDVATGLLVLAVLLLSATLLPFASSAIPAAAVSWALLVTVLAVVVGAAPARRTAVPTRRPHPRN
jgi:mannosyltransferase